MCLFRADRNCLQPLTSTARHQHILSAATTATTSAPTNNQQVERTPVAWSPCQVVCATPCVQPSSRLPVGALECPPTTSQTLTSCRSRSHRFVECVGVCICVSGVCKECLCASGGMEVGVRLAAFAATPHRAIKLHKKMGMLWCKRLHQREAGSAYPDAATSTSPYSWHFGFNSQRFACG